MLSALVAHPWLAAAAVLVVAAALIVLHRRPWRGARTRYPVVLAHGVMGIGTLEMRGARQELYFRGIADHLRSLGVEVHCPTVPAVSSVEDRARALATFVRSMPARRVNLVAHSMGGLDARYAITHLGLGDRVASLVTIGTPHRGTPVADVGIDLVGGKLGVRSLLHVLGIRAFAELTTRRMARFNEDTRNVRRVRYASVIAAVSGDGASLRALLRPIHAFLAGRAGENDGMVPVASQAWGKVLWRVEADHWAEVGWGKDFDAPALYERILRRLRSWGL